MLCTLIGFVGGIIGGMGMGGGTILIPMLILLCNVDPKIAQSVNLLSSIPMSLVALFIHARNKNVIFNLVIPIALFGVCGSIVGSLLANLLSSDLLRKIFGVFLLLFGIYEIKRGLSVKGCSNKK
ncbi:MAG: sulfite exporter TauE/SafE family protein [Peptostreptococcaceae bacterium]|nr:sulfite exporter TauE/SafE family protein [Peptostreptococcaceae bacterium]